MLKSMLDKAKNTQPIATTGIFAHTYYWLTSPTGDLSYKNPSYQPEKKQDIETAIYFIHGTGDQSSAFKRVAERLIQKELPNTISCLHLLSFAQRYQGKSIEFFAEQLRNKIQENQHRRVILIAHSRGGLVAAYFAEYWARITGIEVPLVITVGTPFNGSYLAIKPLSWFSDSVKEMEIDSKFLRQLKEKIINSAQSAYHFFIAQEDAIVPGESGYIQQYVQKNPEALTILDRHGHLSVMSSYRLVHHISFLIHNFAKGAANKTEEKISKMTPFTYIENYFSEESEVSALSKL